MSRARRRWPWFAFALLACAALAFDQFAGPALVARRARILAFREAEIRGRRPGSAGPGSGQSEPGLIPAAPSRPQVPQSSQPAATASEPFDEVTVALPAPWSGVERFVMDGPRAGSAVVLRGRYSGAAGAQRVLQAAVPAVRRPGKIVALTFDDGPGERTSQILDILRQKKALATFFIVGERTFELPYLPAREIAEGHTVANHSWTHNQRFAELSYEQVGHEIRLQDNRLETYLGRRPELFRPPMGAVTQATLDAARDAGKRFIMWSIDPRDYENPPAELIVERVIAQLSPGAIVLLHDNKADPGTVRALPALIDRIRAAGYTLVAL